MTVETWGDVSIHRGGRRDVVRATEGDPRDGLLVLYRARGPAPHVVRFAGSGEQGLHDLALRAGDQVVVCGFAEPGARFGNAPVPANTGPRVRAFLGVLGTDREPRVWPAPVRRPHAWSVARRVHALSNGDVLLIGQVSAGSAERIFLARYRSDGQRSWCREHEGRLPPDGHAPSCVTRRGEVAVVVRREHPGSRKRHPELVAFTACGREAWTWRIRPSKVSEIVDVAELPNGDLAVLGWFRGRLDADGWAGTESDASTGMRLFAARLDRRGRLRWLRTLSPSDAEHALPLELHTTNEGGLRALACLSTETPDPVHDREWLVDVAWDARGRRSQGPRTVGRPSLPPPPAAIWWQGRWVLGP